MQKLKLNLVLNIFNSISMMLYSYQIVACTICFTLFLTSIIILFRVHYQNDPNLGIGFFNSIHFWQNKIENLNPHVKNVSNIQAQFVLNISEENRIHRYSGTEAANISGSINNGISANFQ